MFLYYVAQYKFKEMAGMTVHHLFIHSHSMDPYRITESTCVWN